MIFLLSLFSKTQQMLLFEKEMRWVRISFSTNNNIEIKMRHNLIVPENIVFAFNRKKYRQNASLCTCSSSDIKFEFDEQHEFRQWPKQFMGLWPEPKLRSVPVRIRPNHEPRRILSGMQC